MSKVVGLYLYFKSKKKKYFEKKNTSKILRITINSTTKFICKNYFLKTVCLYGFFAAQGLSAHLWIFQVNYEKLSGQARV